MKNLETVSRKQILNLNKFLSVEQHEVRLSDGRIISDWGWIVSPDYVTICAVDQDHRFICFRQAKYAMPAIAIGPPGGYIEENEIPLEAAKRELLEETGYSSENWIPLASCPSDANRGNGIGNFFLALDCCKQPTVNTQSDDVEDSELVLLTQSELLSELDSGAIIPLPWLLCFRLGMSKLSDVSSPSTQSVVVVAGIIRNVSGQILIAQRASGQNNAGKWEFPGGKLVAGETEAECLAREIHEEFGADITVLQHFAKSVAKSRGITLKLTAWNAKANDTEFSPVVHSEIKWVDTSELAALQSSFCAADRPLIDALCASALPFTHSALECTPLKC